MDRRAGSASYTTLRIVRLSIVDGGVIDVRIRNQRNDRVLIGNPLIYRSAEPSSKRQWQSFLKFHMDARPCLNLSLLMCSYTQESVLVLVYGRKPIDVTSTTASHRLRHRVP